LDDFGNVVSHPSGDYTEKQMLSYARTYHAHMMRKLGGSVVVKVERNRVWIVSGNQSFMLAYEADTAEELNWYADRLRTALSAITPDVKLDGAESVDTPESMAASNARHAIDGAIQFGRENRNPPPSTEHWLYEYWNIGRQLAKLGETGWDNVTPLAPKCRDDDRCQYAIDHGAEGLGHCPAGKCCMPRGGSVEGIDLDMLQALAKDATPGPWTYCPMTETEDPEIGAMNGSRVAALVSADITKQNSRFIAAANPSSVLKLIAAARRAASGGRDGEARTDAQIVQQTEELAAELARYDGFALTAGTFRESASPTAIAYWKRACIAQELLTNTDPMDAAVELIDQQEAVAPLADEQANEQVGGGQ
jgi:hypothetical protein